MSVEGQSEELFVKRILGPFFENKGIWIIPIPLFTGYKNGHKYKGGNTYPDQLHKEIMRLCGEHPHEMVTTFVDRYGFPGIDISKYGAINIKEIESMVFADIHYDNFIPFIMNHEFEALLFSDTEFEAFPEQYRKQLSKILTEYNNDPEEIDSGNPPSKRLMHIYESNKAHYSKIVDGTRIMEKIGLERMRENCHHFNEWIEKLIS